MFVGEVINKVWTLPELSILHELQSPVSVVVYGLFDNSHRHATYALSIRHLLL